MRILLTSKAACVSVDGVVVLVVFVDAMKTRLPTWYETPPLNI